MEFINNNLYCVLQPIIASFLSPKGEYTKYCIAEQSVIFVTDVKNIDDDVEKCKQQYIYFKILYNANIYSETYPDDMFRYKVDNTAEIKFRKWATSEIDIKRLINSSYGIHGEYNITNHGTADTAPSGYTKYNKYTHLKGGYIGSLTHRLPKIKYILINGEYTTAVWEDGTHTVVKVSGDKYDYETAVVYLYMKKMFGNSHHKMSKFISNIKKIIKKPYDNDASQSKTTKRPAKKSAKNK